MIGAEQKITSAHRQRLALVYLRQSSPRQVRENFRSTERQYALQEEAVKLGWQPEQVVAIDQDLGISGRFSDSQARGAFKELVARVCLGEVGAIFGLEVSRLARSSAETQRLLEYCGLTDTLVIDTDGVYDLRDFNDQLVLGVKSQLSQAELHVMAVRLQGAKRHAAERGELRLPLPVGYLYDDEGQVIIDPDQELQAAIADVFAAFAQAGSAYGVLGLFRDRRFPSRAHDGGWSGELRWGRLNLSRLGRILHNPCYAGAYVSGRFRSRRVVAPDGTIKTKLIELPRAEWAVLIKDHHPAYISWEQFLANEQRLASNYTQGGERPAREGPALCQGIVRCGACGRPMSTQYRPWGACYSCHSRSEHDPTPSCRVVKAAPIDALVARRLLEALAPQEITLALNAADELQDRQARSNRAVELRVERARYEAVRAERAFHACEPDNRLVARSLEDRWEQKLRDLKDAEAELAERSVQAPEPSREQLEALARDLPALWAAKTTSDRDRKRLLRALIADVTLKSDPHGPEVLIGIRWQSGATEQHTITRPPRIMKPTPPEALDLLTRLAPHYSNADIASELNAAGLRTGTGRAFDAVAISRLRADQNLPPQPLVRDHELTAKQVAKRLGISPGAVYYWISHGQLEARRSHGNRLCIPFPPEVERQCRERVANSTQMPAQAKATTAGGAV